MQSFSTRGRMTCQRGICVTSWARVRFQAEGVQAVKIRTPYPTASCLRQVSFRQQKRHERRNVVAVVLEVSVEVAALLEGGIGDGSREDGGEDRDVELIHLAVVVEVAGVR